jgi:hypothetical protein
MHRSVILAFALALGLCTAAGAGPQDLGTPPGADLSPGKRRPPRLAASPFVQHLFAPDLVLKHQLAIDLSEDQVTEIKKLIHETHSKTLDAQTDLQRVMERLAGLLSASPVDEAAALAASDQALSLEAQVKTARLSLLIRIKNLLDESQQMKLREIQRRPPQGAR